MNRAEEGCSVFRAWLCSTHTGCCWVSHQGRRPGVESMYSWLPMAAPPTRGRLQNPKAPCSVMVNTWGLEEATISLLWVCVYTIRVHGALGEVWTPPFMALYRPPHSLVSTIRRTSQFKDEFSVLILGCNLIIGMSSVGKKVYIEISHTILC